MLFLASGSAPGVISELRRGVIPVPQANTTPNRDNGSANYVSLANFSSIVPALLATCVNQASLVQLVGLSVKIAPPAVTVPLLGQSIRRSVHPVRPGSTVVKVPLHAPHVLQERTQIAAAVIFTYSVLRANFRAILVARSATLVLKVNIAPRKALLCALPVALMSTTPRVD